MFIQALPQVLKCIGSFDRIQEYCNYSTTVGIPSNDCSISCRQESAINLDNLTKKGYPPAETPLHDAVIAFDRQSFKWNISIPTVLEDLSVEIKRGDMTVVAGPVGSGKSSFLQSVLGELIAIPTRRESATAPVSYCSQQPWLEHGTIRQNIIGISPYDSDWYGIVVSSCDLDTDLRQLENGDQTRIGSNALNLSGGQKQRIVREPLSRMNEMMLTLPQALARAAYARRSVVVLDDVVSGMDANTSAKVIRRLLGQEGLFCKQRATILIATHSRKAFAIS